MDLEELAIAQERLAWLVANRLPPMKESDVSILPNDIIMRIIREAESFYGGRLWSIHKKQFTRCVMELNELNSCARDEIKFCLEDSGWGSAMERRCIEEGIFHYNGHEDDFIVWTGWYNWVEGVSSPFTHKFQQHQGFSTALLAGRREL